MEPQKFSITKRMHSVGYAAAGISRFFRTEHNAWIHLLATLGVVGLTLVFPVTGTEAILLVLSIGFVWAAELFNTCIEKIMDFISTERHPQIQLIKDMSAGAVLIAAITAVIIGSITFIPKVF